MNDGQITTLCLCFELRKTNPRKTNTGRYQIRKGYKFPESIIYAGFSISESMAFAICMRGILRQAKIKKHIYILPLSRICDPCFPNHQS